MCHILTGSLPSMASSQSFRLASENACNVMIPCLFKNKYFIYSVYSCCIFTHLLLLKVQVKLEEKPKRKKNEKREKEKEKR